MAAVSALLSEAEIVCVGTADEAQMDVCLSLDKEIVLAGLHGGKHKPTWRKLILVGQVLAGDNVLLA